MTNPAQELLTIFDSWKGSSGDGIQIARTQSDGMISLNDHLRAMKLVWELAQIVDHWEASGQAVQMYRQGLNAWVSYILAFPYSWQASSGNQQARSSARTDLLEALAHALSLSAPRIDINQLESLSSFLDSIMELLASDNALPEELRKYILKLVQEIRLAWEDWSVSGVSPSEDTFLRLWVALQAAENASHEEKSKWRTLWEGLIRPAGAQFLISLPGTSVTTIAQIVSGS
ncbi:hypothetical protein [Frondihabitans peucedani]|uniref:Uncharacterized protein n=1 Tax=Frondihabitans peucedani TaxID=598626 RepID=A0ABP8DZ22_9MICO